MEPGQILAQTTHCAFTFSQEHPEITRQWINNSNYIVILEIENEAKLNHLFDIAKDNSVPASKFIEPDFKDAVTAIALAPGLMSKKLCGELKLALRKPKENKMILRK